jgi:hypothetical protein
VCAGHEALMAAAAAAISEAESGARGCERSVFATCGVTGSIDIFKIVLSNAEKNRIHVYRRGDFSRCMRHAKDVVSTVGLCTTLQEWILRISDHSIVDTACTC